MAYQIRQDENGLYYQVGIDGSEQDTGIRQDETGVYNGSLEDSGGGHEPSISPTETAEADAEVQTDEVIKPKRQYKRKAKVKKKSTKGRKPASIGV